jgi:hypothetical protein
MIPVRHRRIVRRILIAAVALPLLLASYVCAWAALPGLVQEGVVSRDAVQHVVVIFEPIDMYLASELPGSESVGRFWDYVNANRVGS